MFLSRLNCYVAAAWSAEPKSKWILAILGAVALIEGYYLALSAKGTIDSIKVFFVAVILVILATYLLFIAGSIVILKMLKKKPQILL